MFSKSKAIAALEAKADRFNRSDEELAKQLRDYLGCLSDACARSSAAVCEQLAAVQFPGARPSTELDAAHAPALPFAERFNNQEEARAWAKGVLSGVTTLAVDGSQIAPSKDYSLPAAVVQVGWFLNPHDPAQSYVKDIAMEVLGPDELHMEGDGAYISTDQIVGLRRFEGECHKIIEYMKKWGDGGEAGGKIAFLDGSLVVSFAKNLRDRGIRQRYLQAAVQLLSTSEKTRVPLIAYIDTSYARDVVSMLSHLDRSAGSGGRVGDAALFHHEVGDWGCRSIAFQCVRDKLLDEYVDVESRQPYGDSIYFCYLRSRKDVPPARLEFPRWMLDDGVLDWAIDVVRAEAIIGNGYPYAIETADAVSVLSVEDREHFYLTLQEFAKKHGLSMRVSTKSISKRHRRV